MKEEKEKRIEREILEKITNGIIFVGTLVMVFIIGFTLLSFVSEMWLPILIAFPFVYVIYRWLGIVLTGILFFAIVLIILLAPVFFS